MKKTLPNFRLLGLNSVSGGEDWYDLTLRIDSALHDLGLELAYEGIILTFPRAPGFYLDQAGPCRVFRPVVGVKRLLPPPWLLEDLTSFPVESFALKSSSWTELRQESFEHWEQLQRENKLLEQGFMLFLQRTLEGSEKVLRLKAEVVFPLGNNF